MKKLFNNILVPLGLEENGGVAIQEAIRIAAQWHCHIHLLYYTPGLPAVDEERSELLKATILERYRPLMNGSVSMVIQWLQGPPEKNIIDYCHRHEIDLILLGRARRPFWQIFRRNHSISMDRLLKKVQCPILTIFGQPVITAIKNIVLPVGRGLPMRKLLFATYLARTAGSTIHLVSVDGRSGEGSREAGESLYRSYRLLRENTSLPVECLSMPGENLADVAWRYARDIKADLILIHPGKESLLSGFFNGRFTRPLHELYSRALFNVSRIPVMTVS